MTNSALGVKFADAISAITTSGPAVCQAARNT